MRYLKLALIALLLLAPLKLKSEVVPDYQDRKLRLKLCQETYNYYKKFGYERDWNEYRAFMFSSYRVAKMFPMYPAKDLHDRMLQFFELGEAETMWKKNNLEVNIPGANYGELKVKRLSVDYGWAAVNEINVNQTYWIAKAIQSGKPIPLRYSTPSFREILKNAKIPKELKLRKIDLSYTYDAREIYKDMKDKGYSPNKIRRELIFADYIEETQNEIDSILIYRVIEELERMNLGWTYGHRLYSKERNLYNHLSKVLEDEKTK